MSAGTTQEAPDPISVQVKMIDEAVGAIVLHCAECGSDFHEEAPMASPGLSGLADIANEHMRGEHLDDDPPLPPAAPLPPGIYGRIELPGWRNHTGWITDELAFGSQMAVVKDWDGRVLAMVGAGPLVRIVPLPVPLKRPEEPKAITSTWGGGREEDEDPEGYDEDDPY